MQILSDQLELDRCPHCGVSHPNLASQHQLITNSRVGGASRAWKIYVCQRCGRVVTGGGQRAKHIEHTEITEVYPATQEVDSAIPPPASDYLAQALETIHAPSGAIMLSASAVDAMLKTKDYLEGSLYARIDSAVDANLITNDMAKWAHEVRLDANDQRHADEMATLTVETDARRAVDFALALGQILFVLPSQIKRGLENLDPVQEVKNS